jgi:ABC-type multidrug transport system fused ATPase/permease subunit
MDLEKAIKSGSQKLKASNGIKIEFKGVSFKYPNTDNYVLKNINLTIHPGEEVAIVGKNGAGKSTLIKLILRFYDPTEGEIFINDIEIKKLNIASYYKHISALFQDFNQYKALTARENILIGTQEIESETKESDSSETSAIPSEINEKLMKSLKQTDAVNFIKNLGKGLDTPLGKNFTGGTELSKGQWQKIALSRILYRNSEMLILDEPTASIDAQAELKIFNNIYEFSENKTVILISHRFSSVRKAEKIFVIEDGKIVESGDHEELMKLEGSYAKSFEIQAEGYK